MTSFKHNMHPGCCNPYNVCVTTMYCFGTTLQCLVVLQSRRDCQDLRVKHMYSYFFDPPDFAKNLIEISFIAYLTRKLLKKKKHCKNNLGRSLFSKKRRGRRRGGPRRYDHDQRLNVLFKPSLKQRGFFAFGQKKGFLCCFC